MTVLVHGSGFPRVAGEALQDGELMLSWTVVRLCGVTPSHTQGLSSRAGASLSSQAGSGCRACSHLPLVSGRVPQAREEHLAQGVPSQHQRRRQGRGEEKGAR